VWAEIAPDSGVVREKGKHVEKTRVKTRENAILPFLSRRGHVHEWPMPGWSLCPDPKAGADHAKAADRLHRGADAGSRELGHWHFSGLICQLIAGGLLQRARVLLHVVGQGRVPEVRREKGVAIESLANYFHIRNPTYMNAWCKASCQKVKRLFLPIFYNY
jgi:hypothetical protein